MRLSVAVAAVSLSIIGLAVADDVRASIKRPTNIPSQALGPALQTLAKDRNFQVVYVSEEVNSLRTHGAVGEFTSEEALKQLLSGTGMTFRYLDENTVTIVRVSSSSTSGGAGPDSPSSAPAGATPTDSQDKKKERKKSVWDQIRVAQVDQGTPASSPSVEGRNQRASDQKPVKLEEVIVTAQKREERLIDVPMSITALGADELQQRQVTSLEDLPSAVPDLAYTKAGSSYLFEIRGISNVSGTSPLIGLYIDEADVTLGGTSTVEINPVTYDLERVEVLRGPQGTLYGEGSAGGTIRFITKSPNLSNFSFDSQVAALFTEGGDPSQRINAVVNLPLTENQLGLRIAGTFEHDGGWIDQPVADQKHIHGQDLTNVRIKGLWQPDPNFTVSTMAIINRNDRGADFSDVNSPQSFTQAFNLTNTPRVRSDYELYNLTMAYDFSAAARILNTISYLRESAPTWNVGSAYPILPPGNPPVESYVPLQRTADHLLTDELRLTSMGSGRWQWTVGGFFRRFQERNEIPLYYSALLGPPGAPLPTPFSISNYNVYKSWSAFGDTSYRLSDRLTVGAGVRYFREDQDSSDFVAGTVETGRFHSTDPRAYAQFKLTPDMNVYASAAKGFRSGGFNSFPPGAPNFEPESVWTYELGTKMAFLEGRIGFDTAVFWSNYVDYQTFGVVAGGAFSDYSNAGRARVKGIEGNLTWHLTPWRLEARGDYLNGRFTEINATQTAYEVGDPLDLAPRYQFTLSGQRDFSWLGKPGVIRLDYSQQGPETYRNRNVSGPTPWFYAESDVVQLLNLHTSLLLNDNLRLGVFAQNLLNDQSFLNPGYFVGQGVRSRPRTFGIELSVTFD